MTAAAILIRPIRSIAPSREQVMALAAAGLSGLFIAALLRRLASGQELLPIGHSVWLAIHLASVIPTLPLGAYVLIRRKGDRLHRLLGRLWAMLMMTAALSSFGLHGLTGRLSWIHLLSLLTLVTIPRGVMQAMRGDIARHRRSMTLVYAGLVTAGAFSFVPGRLIGTWLFG